MEEEERVKKKSKKKKKGKHKEKGAKFPPPPQLKPHMSFWVNSCLIELTQSTHHQKK